MRHYALVKKSLPLKKNNVKKLKKEDDNAGKENQKDDDAGKENQKDDDKESKENQNEEWVEKGCYGNQGNATTKEKALKRKGIMESTECVPSDNLPVSTGQPSYVYSFSHKYGLIYDHYARKLEWGFISTPEEKSSLDNDIPRQRKLRSINKKPKDTRRLNSCVLTGIEESLRMWNESKEAIMLDVFWKNLSFFDRFTPVRWTRIKIKKEHVTYGLFFHSLFFICKFISFL
ncbi:MAG: hypothetical protein GY714_23170 [Desulfobacterales bacterium]|nr:hypothetical protein [Desulfobacterales bacterium]